MKIIKKQLLIIFCIVTCMFVLSSCGKNEEEKIPFSYNENELVSCVKNNTETVGNMSEDELDELIAQYDNATDDVSVTLKKGLEEWKRAVKESGKFIKMRENIRNTRGRRERTVRYRQHGI